MKPIRKRHSKRDLITHLPPEGPEPDTRSDYGAAGGDHSDRQSPFFVGFVAAFGVLVACGLCKPRGQLTQVIALLMVAFFLTRALNPLVETLSRRGPRWPPSVAIVLAQLVAAFTALGFVVGPPVAQQGSLLTNNAPKYLHDPLSNHLVQDMHGHYRCSTRSGWSSRNWSRTATS